MASLPKKFKNDASMFMVRLCDSFKRTPQNFICPFIRAEESVRVFYRLQQESLKKILEDAGKEAGLQLISISWCPGGRVNSTLDGNIFIEYKSSTKLLNEDSFTKYKDFLKLRLQHFNISNVLVDRVDEQSPLSQPVIKEIDYKIHELDFQFQNYASKYQDSEEGDTIPDELENIKTLLTDLKDRKIQIAVLSHNAIGKSFLLNLLLLLTAENNRKAEEGNIKMPKDIKGNPTVRMVKEELFEELPEVIRDFVDEIKDDEQDFKNLVQPICHELNFNDQEELERMESSFSSLSGYYTHQTKIDIEPYLLPQKDICGDYNATTNCVFYLRYGSTFQAKVKYFDENELQNQLFELVPLENGEAERRRELVNERMQKKAQQSLKAKFKILTKNAADIHNKEDLQKVLRSITSPGEIELCEQVKEIAGKTELYIGNGKNTAADRLALQELLKGFTLAGNDDDSDEKEDKISQLRRHKITSLKSLEVYVPSTLLYGGTEIMEMPGTNDSDPLAMSFIQEALNKVDVVLLLSEFGFRLAGQEVRDCLKNSRFIKHWIKDSNKYKLMFISYPEKNLIYQFGAKNWDRLEKTMLEEDKKKEEEFQRFKELLHPVHLSPQIKPNIFSSTVLPVLHSSILSLVGDPRDILEKNGDFLKNTGIDLLFKEFDQIMMQRKKSTIMEIEKELEDYETSQKEKTNDEQEDDTPPATLNIDVEQEREFLRKNEDLFNKMKDNIADLIKYAVNEKLKNILEISCASAVKIWNERLKSEITDAAAFNPQYNGRHPAFKTEFSSALLGDLEEEVFPVFEDLTENLHHVVDDYKERAITLFTEKLRDKKQYIPAKSLETALGFFLGKTRASFNENTLMKNFENLYQENLKTYVLEPAYRDKIENTKHKMVTYIQQVLNELQISFLKNTLFLYEERWPTNLAQFMVRSSVPRRPQPGFTFCGNLRCSLCIYVSSTTTFTSTATKKVYPISGSFTCKTNNAIYLITCKKCEKQYVGQTTQTVRERFTDHLSTIKCKKEILLAQHFSSDGHSNQDITLVVIKQEKDAKNLLKNEKELIQELNTLQPAGLNARIS